MPILDASFLIDLERSNPRATAALEQLAGHELVVPGHAALQVMSGQKEPVAALMGLRRSYRVLLARDETLIVAAGLRLDAREKGKRPSGGDVYIAAAAKINLTYVVTANPRDFEALGCSVWDYRSKDKPPA